MSFREQKGAITVYLSIILLVVIVLVGTVVDGARVRIGESQVERAVESAAMSSLAGYLKPLKEDYGLFALAENNPDQLKAAVEEYMNGTLMTGLGGDKEELAKSFYGEVLSVLFKDEYKNVNFINLFDYRIDKTGVTPCYNLSENEVIRNQIVEFMKYRAPKQLGTELAKKTGLLSMAQEMKKAGNSSKALDKKINLDDLLGKLGSKQTELAGYVSTARLFPEDDGDQYNGRSKVEGDLLRNYTGLDREYKAAAENYLKKAGEGENTVSKNSVADKFEKVEISLEACRKINEKCVETAESIIQLKKDIESTLSEYGLFVDREKENLEADFIDSMNEELELAREVLNKDNSETVKERAENNAGTVNLVMTKLNRLNDRIGSYADKGPEAYIQSWEEASGALGLEGKGSYDNSLAYSYLSLEEWKAKKSRSSGGIAKKKDTREEAEQAKRALEKEASSKDYLKEIDEAYYTARPSRMEGGRYPNKILSEKYSAGQDKGSDNSGAEESELESTVGGSLSFGKNGSYSEGDIANVKVSLDNLASMGDKLSDFLISSRDELYLNEYIMGMFTNDVPLIKKQSKGTLEVTADSSRDLRLRLKADDRKAYLRYGEVEYILFGKRSEESNIKAASLAIGGVRFGLNLAALHRMPEKLKEATLVAEAIAAGMAAATGGAGAAASAASVNAIREAVLAGWASLEAYQDIKYLREGRMIPVWKDENTWITDEDGGIKAIDRGDSSSLLRTSYHDYLRLFLLVMSAASKDTKLNRLEDILQYNLQSSRNPAFKLADYNTYIKVDTVVSMKYFFVTFAFMPKRLKTEDGRHGLKAAVLQGY